jgi:hypothetical protein
VLLSLGTGSAVASAAETAIKPPDSSTHAIFYRYDPYRPFYGHLGLYDCVVSLSRQSWCARGARGSSPAMLFHPTMRLWPARNFALSAFLSTLPRLVTGNESTNSTCFGAWAEPLRALTRSVGACELGRAPVRGTTIAATASPHFGWDMPTTATMATSGWVAGTDLAGKHAQPAAHDHVLLATGDEEIALLVGTRDVTRVQPAVLQCLHGLFGLLPIFAPSLPRVTEKWTAYRT